MMIDKTVSIAICADEKLSLCGAMALYSTSLNIKPGFHINAYVVDSGIKQSSRERFEKVFSKMSHVSLIWLTPDLNKIMDLPVATWVSIAANARLLLPSILPQGMQRILYIDSDMIVLGDVSELFGKTFDGEYVFAVQDGKYPDVGSCRSSDVLTTRGLDPAAPYFNSGLLLIDIPNWVEGDVSARVMGVLNSIGEKFTHRDQDALNIVMYNKWGLLDPRWNVLPHLFKTDRSDEQQIAKEAKIIHYTGLEKPTSLFNTHPRRSLFLRYVSKSGWFSLPEWIRWRTRSRIIKYHSNYLKLKGYFQK